MARKKATGLLRDQQLVMEAGRVLRHAENLVNEAASLYRRASLQEQNPEGTTAALKSLTAMQGDIELLLDSINEELEEYK